MMYCQSFIYVSLLSWRMLKTLTCSSLWFSGSNTRSKWLLCVLIHFWQLIILYAAFVCCRIKKCEAFMRNTVSHVQENYVPQHESSVSFQFSWFLHQFYKLYTFILSNIQRNEFCFIYRQTDRQTVTFCNRSIQYYQQPEVAELPLHELEIHDSSPQFIV